jgi:hypothetical protein
MVDGLPRPGGVRWTHGFGSEGEWGTAASLGSAGCGGGFQVSDQNRRTSGGGSAWREWGAGRWACPVPVPIYRASQPGGIEVRPVPASYEVLMVFLKK